MTNDAENDVVHLKAGDQLPAVPSPSPTIEILKQLLEQMLANERRRLRNEYVRITILFLVLLAAAIGGGLWFTNSLLDQLRAERQTAERSLQALLQRVSPAGNVSGDVSGEALAKTEALAKQGDQRSEVSNTSALDLRAPAADANTAHAQADIQRILADLETKKQAIADMLKTQDAQTKELLQSRDSELQILHERMKEVQRNIMNAAPPEAQPVKKVPAPPAIEEVAVDSLIVTTSNAVTLRLPIPPP